MFCRTVPGEADARLEVGDAVVLVVKRPAVAVLSGDFDGAADQPEVGLAVFHFDPRRVQFPAQTEIEGQVGGNVPIVLEERGEDVRALSPGSAIDAAADLRGQAEQEVRFRHTAAAAGDGIASGFGPAV